MEEREEGFVVPFSRSSILPFLPFLPSSLILFSNSSQDSPTLP